MKYKIFDTHAHYDTDRFDEDRENVIKELKENVMLRGDIIESLKKVYDIERLAGKISYGNANGRDMIS